VVVNTVGEGEFPAPAHFTLELDGLSTDDIAAGAIPVWGPGCVVNFTAPPQQAYICRKVQLSVGAAETVSLLSDYIGPTETAIYQIGCELPAASATNYVVDAGFEGGSLRHPMPSSAGVPGYNLDDHTACEFPD